MVSEVTEWTNIGSWVKSFNYLEILNKLAAKPGAAKKFGFIDNYLMLNLPAN